MALSNETNLCQKTLFSNPILTKTGFFTNVRFFLDRMVDGRLFRGPGNCLISLKKEEKVSVCTCIADAKCICQLYTVVTVHTIAGSAIISYKSVHVMLSTIQLLVLDSCNNTF